VGHDLKELYRYKDQLEQQLQEIVAAEASCDLEAEAFQALRERMLDDLRRSRLEVLAEILRLEEKNP